MKLSKSDLVNAAVGILYLFPLSGYVKPSTQRDNSLQEIKTISAFIREVLFKAQIFVNYFILKYPQDLTNSFFDKNFWYTITRAI